MTLGSLQPIIYWITEHPTWSGIVVCLISLSESLAIVGLIVPGVVLMTAIGSLIGAGILPAWETLGWAMLGAVAGDGISYWLGYHFHEHIKQFWPFRRFPQWLARGEQFFQHHGGTSIIMGRFIGPIRPTIPVIAGMMGMTPKKFLIFNILSAILWAPLYSLPGILMGASLGSLPAEVAGRVGVWVLILLLVLWILYSFILKLVTWVTNTVAHALAQTWFHWKASHRLQWLHRALATAQGTEEGQLGTALLFLLSSTAFLWILTDVATLSDVTRWNEPIYQTLRALYSDAIVDYLAHVTDLAAPWVLGPTAAFVAVWLYCRHRYTASLCWAATIGIGLALGQIIKTCIVSIRPEGLIYVDASHSFPSGHVLAATLVYGLTATLCQQALPRNVRWIPWSIALPLIFLVAFSRLYLGLHWFTDTMGGLTLGTACVSFGILLYRRFEHDLPPLPVILFPCLLALSASTAIYTLSFYDTERAQLTREWPRYLLAQGDWWQGSQSAQLQTYRNGAFKHHATLFDIQWLGSLESIQSTLHALNWLPVPRLTLNSAAMMLANHPASDKVPSLPRFHRDRLPVLVLTQAINETERFLLQLWHSDYTTAEGVPLWVGTLRIEQQTHPIPLTTVYRESEHDPRAVTCLRQMLILLNSPRTWEGKLISLPTPVLLLRKEARREIAKLSIAHENKLIA